MAKIKKIVTSEIEGNTYSPGLEENTYSYNTLGNITYHSANGPIPISRPGMLFGANGDSGDGNGLNTLKLVPHSADGDVVGDQYLIIDPTQPNHIHIRAGGQMDQSTAELILGAENNHVSVSDQNNSVNILASSININSYTSPSSLNINTYSGATVNSARTSSYAEEDKIVATLGDIKTMFPQSVSWTPEVSGVGFVQTSNTATGTYLKYGSMVVVNMLVPFTNVTNFGTGQYSVTLPFPAKQHADVFAGSIHNTGPSTDHYSLKGHLADGSSSMTLWYISGSSKDEPFKHNAPITVNTTDLFHMHFIYEIQE